MNYADIKLFDVANGTGVRVSVFVSGSVMEALPIFIAMGMR